MDSLQLKLYRRANTTDSMWQAELIREFGDLAGTARYDKRGGATPALYALREAARQASAAWSIESRKLANHMAGPLYVY